MVSNQQAIHAIGKATKGRGIDEGPGISSKLSALQPRYSRAHYDRVMEELYPRLKSHTLLARLVRRLLENGANTSFVNRIADTSLPLDELVADQSGGRRSIRVTAAPSLTGSGTSLTPG